MTAPTTRETADHAELAEAHYIDLFRAIREAGRSDSEKANAASKYLASILLSEIAALRTAGEIIAQKAENAIQQGFAHIERATQAERQRDEARDTIASTVAKADWMQGHLSGERSSIDRETIELVVSECRAYCHLQALANQGADQ